MADRRGRKAVRLGSVLANVDLRPGRSTIQREEPPKPHPELRRLEPLVGTWKTKDHTRDSVLSPGVTVESIETFAWLDGGYFLASVLS